jgi:manganese-dependent ADP-ribose/CDP-alcohol diphosphatase
MGDSLFWIGVLADPQYADIPDGGVEGRRQAYREVPGKLAAALAAFASRGPLPAACILQLGDIINGSPANSAAEFEQMAASFDLALIPTGIPAVHVIGNHCLSVPRTTLVERLRLPGSYYVRPLPHGWRLVVLDTTEMSGHSGYPDDSKEEREAREFVAAHQLGPEHPQMSGWNGGCTKRQLAWLRRQLAEADAAGERVLAAAHHQVRRMFLRFFLYVA